MKNPKQVIDDNTKLCEELLETLFKEMSNQAVETFKRNLDKLKVGEITGTLRNSIKASNININGNKSESTIIADCDYAEYINNGTDKMAPKPFMEPTYYFEKKWKDEINNVVIKSNK